ncbi:MAG: OmpA family protein [Myxococcales bacterium]|nr:OmpA family protein [Myxococcales bacterium]MCB9732047.1 OmpA family protein [Deltaproteobacteria bacterium]
MTTATRALTTSLTLAALAMTSGCVTKGKYRELETEYGDYRAQTEERDRRQEASIQDLEQALAAEKARLAHIEEERKSLEAQLEALNAEKAKLVKEKSGLLESEKQMREALDELSRRKAQAEARVAEYRNLLARFKALIDAGKLKIRIIDGQMVVQLATDVLFPSGSAVLSENGHNAVVEVTAILKDIADRRFQVAGHTDNVPIKTSRYPSNWELAFDRSMSVVRTMIESGMPPSRVSAASYGEFKPTAPNDTDEGKAQNRRIEIMVVPDLSTLPGAEELEKLGDG